MTFRYFESFREGDEIDLGSYYMSSEEIIEFAEEFDPIYYHLDAEMAKKSSFGELCASGWHTCSATMRMMCDSFLLESTGQGAPGIENAIWHNPVYAGSTICGRALVLSTRLSRSREGIGIVQFRFEFFIQGNRPVLTVENIIMFATREHFERMQNGEVT